MQRETWSRLDRRRRRWRRDCLMAPKSSRAPRTRAAWMPLLQGRRKSSVGIVDAQHQRLVLPEA